MERGYAYQPRAVLPPPGAGRGVLCFALAYPLPRLLPAPLSGAAMMILLNLSMI